MQGLEEADELQQLGVILVVVPGFDGDAVVDVVAIGVGGVVDQQRLCQLKRNRQTGGEYTAE